jgi:hypothetical protein
VGVTLYAPAPIHKAEPVDGAENVSSELVLVKVPLSEVAGLDAVPAQNIAEVEVPDKESCGVGCEACERSGELQGPLLVGFAPQAEVEHVGVKVAVKVVGSGGLGESLSSFYEEFSRFERIVGAGRLTVCEAAPIALDYWVLWLLRRSPLNGVSKLLKGELLFCGVQDMVF